MCRSRVQEEGHLDLNRDIKLFCEKLQLGILRAEIKPIVIEANFTECYCMTTFFGREGEGFELCEEDVGA